MIDEQLKSHFKTPIGRHILEVFLNSERFTDAIGSPKNIGTKVGELNLTELMQFKFEMEIFQSLLASCKSFCSIQETILGMLVAFEAGRAAERETVQLNELERLMKADETYVYEHDKFKR